jgi:hypothetical protein
VRGRKFNVESAQLQAGRCDFGHETSSMTTVNFILECTMPDVFELIAMSSPLSRAHDDLALPSLSNGLPAVIEFAKAGA